MAILLDKDPDDKLMEEMEKYQSAKDSLTLENNVSEQSTAHKLSPSYDHFPVESLAVKHSLDVRSLSFKMRLNKPVLVKQSRHLTY